MITFSRWHGECLYHPQSEGKPQSVRQSEEVPVSGHRAAMKPCVIWRALRPGPPSAQLLATTCDAAGD
jgi:hypothetical protein